jgi:NAD(P)-dependent dehydrogenase (short-subunit alcohol dehydrogenase family)
VRVAADELGPRRIRVNAVRPGLTPTDMSTALMRDDAVRADYLAQMPLGRVGTVDDIAAGVRYLVGPEAAWVTGQVFAIDGGHTLRRGPNVDPLVRPTTGR